jgi:hypothetical protein
VTPRQEAGCLAYDPWGFDETPYVLLSDRFVIARKPHGCMCCGHMIRPGQRVRARAEIDLDDGLKGTFYWCVQCCEAMERAQRDDGKSLEHRFAMGMHRREPGNPVWSA